MLDEPGNAGHFNIIHSEVTEVVCDLCWWSDEWNGSITLAELIQECEEHVAETHPELGAVAP